MLSMNVIFKKIDYKLNLETKTILGKKGRIENGCVIVAANMKKSRNSNSAQVRTLRCRVTVFRIKTHEIFKTYELSKMKKKTQFSCELKLHSIQF